MDHRDRVHGGTACVRGGGCGPAGRATGSPAALLAAALALAACARQVPPPEPPVRPAVQRPARPAPPRPATRSEQPDPARADRDRQAEAVCARRGGLVEEEVRDAGGTGLGLDGVLAGQSAREACLRGYRQTGEVPAPL